MYIYIYIYIDMCVIMLFKIYCAWMWLYMDVISLSLYLFRQIPRGCSARLSRRPRPKPRRASAQGSVCLPRRKRSPARGAGHGGIAMGWQFADLKKHGKANLANSRESPCFLFHFCFCFVPWSVNFVCLFGFWCLFLLRIVFLPVLLCF